MSIGKDQTAAQATSRGAGGNIQSKGLTTPDEEGIDRNNDSEQTANSNPDQSEQ